MAARTTSPRDGLNDRGRGTGGSSSHISGHTYLAKRKKGAVWYFKIRHADGREERKALGPEWRGQGEPASGLLHQAAGGGGAARAPDRPAARGGEVPSSGATFADAAERWFAVGCTERAWKPATARCHRSELASHL